MSFVAIAIGASAVIGAGTSLYENAQSREAANKAINSEQNILGNLQYQPIHIASLQKQATAESIAYATKTLAQQPAFQPNVARSNDLLQKRVAVLLAEGGILPPDVAYDVAEGARVYGGSSGSIGSAGPETAALIGQSSLGLLQQRQANAAALEAANPAPTVGLSATDLASAIEANNNASNQFALAKAGAQTGLLNSQAQAAAGGKCRNGCQRQPIGVAPVLARDKGSHANIAAWGSEFRCLGYIRYAPWRRLPEWSSAGIHQRVGESLAHGHQHRLRPRRTAIGLRRIAAVPIESRQDRRGGDL